jgi:hypothetical protein
MRHCVADAEETAGVQHRHSRGQPGARGRTVEPTGRDDDCVPRDRPHPAPRLGELNDADARDLRILRVEARQLLPRGSRRSSRRSESSARSASIWSKTVFPRGGKTPPTITLPISPPAWQPTTVIIRRLCTIL